MQNPMQIGTFLWRTPIPQGHGNTTAAALQRVHDGSSAGLRGRVSPLSLMQGRAAKARKFTVALGGGGVPRLHTLGPGPCSLSKRRDRTELSSGWDSRALNVTAHQITGAGGKGALAKIEHM